MKKRLLRYIIITVLITGLLILPNTSIGQEKEIKRIIGKIIEMSPKENMIQVKDRNYIVSAVYIDDGSTEDPILGSFSNLEVGDIVEASIGDKYDGFWEAKKVIKFTGDKKKEILKKLED